MYKTADFIHALHKSNTLEFQYAILFVAYGMKSDINSKFLLYTDINSKIAPIWQCMISLLTDLNNDANPTVSRNVFQLDLAQSQVSLKIDPTI